MNVAVKNNNNVGAVLLFRRSSFLWQSFFETDFEIPVNKSKFFVVIQYLYFVVFTLSFPVYMQHTIIMLAYCIIIHKLYNNV